MKNKIRFILLFFTVTIFFTASHGSLADEDEPGLAIIEMMPEQPMDTLVIPENKTPALLKPPTTHSKNRVAESGY